MRKLVINIIASLFSIFIIGVVIFSNSNNIKMVYGLTVPPLSSKQEHTVQQIINEKYGIDCNIEKRLWYDDFYSGRMQDNNGVQFECYIDVDSIQNEINAVDIQDDYKESYMDKLIEDKVNEELSQVFSNSYVRVRGEYQDFENIDVAEMSYDSIYAQKLINNVNLFLIVDIDAKQKYDDDTEYKKLLEILKNCQTDVAMQLNAQVTFLSKSEYKKCKILMDDYDGVYTYTTYDNFGCDLELLNTTMCGRGMSTTYAEAKIAGKNKENRNPHEKSLIQVKFETLRGHIWKNVY